MNDIRNDDLSPRIRAVLCEDRAAELLCPDSGLTPHHSNVAEAQALATLAQSFRLREVEEWLASIRDDGVGVG